MPEAAGKPFGCGFLTAGQPGGAAAPASVAGCPVPGTCAAASACPSGRSFLGFFRGGAASPSFPPLGLLPPLAACAGSSPSSYRPGFTRRRFLGGDARSSICSPVFSISPCTRCHPALHSGLQRSALHHVIINTQQARAPCCCYAAHRPEAAPGCCTGMSLRNASHATTVVHFLVNCIRMATRDRSTDACQLGDCGAPC